MIKRRCLLQLAGAAIAAPAFPNLASALQYPSRPVRWLVGTAAGGAQDVIARMMGQRLSEHLGQQFIVENRPGANGNIAVEAAVNAVPDGYTLLQFGTASAINATLYEKLNFSLVRDIEPIAGIMRFPNVLVINPSVPARTVPEFIAYANAHPGMLNMGSGGNGSAQHVSGELFKMMTGVNLVHVPYRGGAPAITDLIGGQIQVIFSPTLECLEHIKAGRLHALAVTTDARLEVLPGIPTVAEFVPGYESTGWMGVGAPKNTPAAIVEELNDEINAGLNDPQIMSRLASLSVVGFPLSSSNFRNHVTAEVEKWGKVIKAAHIKVE
jgi:tripartite-type tricarboxylate transporter receptor subunit TctC